MTGIDHSEPISPRRLIILVVATALFLYSCGGGADKQPVSNSEQLRRFHPLEPSLRKRLADSCRIWYDTALVAGGFNGGMLVVKNGETVFEAYNGTAHLPGSDTITDSTPLHVASVSKTFTAMAVLQLVRDRRLGLDDSLTRFFPEFNYPGVTVRMLLNHRSGLPNYLHFMERLGWDKHRAATNADVFGFLVNMKRQMTGIGKADAGFRYCNTNYVVLALLIEKISGMSYRQYLDSNIFMPLGMRHSFVYDTSMARSVVPSYDARGTEMAITCLDAVYGDKNIYTTPRDLMRWDAALYDTSFMPRNLLDAAFAPYSFEKPGIRNYGLGWRLFLLPSGKKIIYHNGWWHGNNASFIRLPQDTAVIILTGNRFNRTIYQARTLARFFGDYGFRDEEEDAVAAGVPDGQKKKRQPVR